MDTFTDRRPSSIDMVGIFGHYVRLGRMFDS